MEHTISGITQTWNIPLVALHNGTYHYWHYTMEHIISGITQWNLPLEAYHNGTYHSWHYTNVKHTFSGITHTLNILLVALHIIILIKFCNCFFLK